MNIEAVAESNRVALSGADFLGNSFSMEGLEATGNRDLRTLVIADTDIEDAAVLLERLEPGTDLWWVDARSNFADTLDNALSGRYETLHFVGHGQPGSITLGGNVLDAEDFTALSKVDVEAPSIHFWSCMTGAGAKGRAFVHRIAEAFDTVVTAFSGLVGAGDKGGSWLPDVFSRADALVAVPFGNASAYRYTLSASALQLKSVATTAGVDIQVWLTAGTVIDAADIVLSYDTMMAIYTGSAANSVLTGWSWFANPDPVSPNHLLVTGISLNPLNSASDLLLETFSFALPRQSAGFTVSLVGGSSGTALTNSTGTDPLLGTLPTITYAVAPVDWTAIDFTGTPSDTAGANEFLLDFYQDAAKQSETGYVASINNTGSTSHLYDTTGDGRPDRFDSLSTSGNTSGTITWDAHGGFTATTTVGGNKVDYGRVTTDSAGKPVGFYGFDLTSYLLVPDTNPFDKLVSAFTISASEKGSLYDNELGDGIVDSLIVTSSSTEGGQVQTDTSNYRLVWSDATHWTAHSLQELVFGTSYDSSGRPTTVMMEGAVRTIAWQTAGVGNVIGTVSFSTQSNGVAVSAVLKFIDLNSDDKPEQATYTKEGIGVTGYTANASLAGWSYDSSNHPLSVTAEIFTSTQTKDLFSGMVTGSNSNPGAILLPSSSQSYGITVNTKYWKSETPIKGVVLETAHQTGDTGSVTLGDHAAGFTTLTPALTADAAAKGSVDLLDAIAILKSIVGLTTLNGYQQVAADFDKANGVDLNDAIGILKHVVGLTAPTPEWAFVARTDLLPDPGHAISVDVIADTTVDLVGILRGDVDGSWSTVPHL